jgi:hypothetical protein
MNFVWWKSNQDTECKTEMPKEFTWLLVNIIIYFGFFFIFIFVQLRQWFAAPSEKEIEEAVQHDELLEKNEAKPANSVN